MVARQMAAVNRQHTQQTTHMGFTFESRNGGEREEKIGKGKQAHTLLVAQKLAFIDSIIA